MPVDDLTWIREWIGAAPDDDAVNARLEAYDDNRTQTAISILRERRANLLIDPLSYSIRGDVTVNAQANLAALDDLIKRLIAIGVAEGDLDPDAEDTIQSATLERQDTWGRGLYPKGVDPGWRRVAT